MIVTTPENIPGYRGHVFGVVVRSQELGGNIMPGLRSIRGGEIAEYTKMLEEWAAAGSVDTHLSFLRLFELYGAAVAKRRMPTRGVVEPLDVVEHVGTRLVTSSVHLAPHAFGLHGTEEALHG